jgi:hypothetical protein
VETASQVYRKCDINIKICFDVSYNLFYSIIIQRCIMSCYVTVESLAHTSLDQTVLFMNLLDVEREIPRIGKGFWTQKTFIVPNFIMNSFDVHGELSCGTKGTGAMWTLPWFEFLVDSLDMG